MAGFFYRVIHLPYDPVIPFPDTPRKSMLSKRQMLRVDSFIVAQNNLLHQQNEETTAAFSHKRTNTYMCNNMDGSKNQVSRLPGPVVKHPPANIGDAGSVSGPRRLCMS